MARLAPSLLRRFRGAHFVFATTCALSGCSYFQTVPPEHRRAVVMSFDGAGERLIERMLAEGVMPRLARLRAEGHDVAWAGCGVPGGDAHAGFTETSTMLHLAPDLVRPPDAVTGDTRTLAELMPELIARGVRAVSPSGVLGDPAGASAEAGRAIVRAMVASVAGRIAAARADHRGRLLDPADTSRQPT